MKIVSKQSIPLARLQAEIVIQRNAVHENILRLYETLEDSQYHYMIMEYAAAGELFDKIRKIFDILKSIELTTAIYIVSYAICGIYKYNII